MTTSAELEVLKEKIRKMPASKKKGSAVYQALQLWIPLQEKEDWLRLVNNKTGKLNQREIAAELCATDNIWKTERFKKLLEKMNCVVQENDYVQLIDPGLSRENISSKVHEKAETSPLKELAEMRLRAKLQLTEGKLHQANIRIMRLEKELKKYTEVYICTPAGEFADRVQELHIKILHILIEMIERHFHPENYKIV